jgi:hypothetical protein
LVQVNILLFYVCVLRYLGQIDGMNAWMTLSYDLPSNRTSVLHNIDDIYGNAALTVGDWKVVKGKESYTLQDCDVNTLNTL